MFRDIILPCWTEDVCHGGNSTLEQCADGHGGPLCGICQSGWAMGSGSLCVECNADGVIQIASNPVTWVAAVCVSTFSLILLALPTTVMIRRYRRKRHDDKGEDIMKHLRETLDEAYDTVSETIEAFNQRVLNKAKVIIAFFQIAGSFRETFNIPYPEEFTRFMEQVSGVVGINLPNLMS